MLGDEHFGIRLDVDSFSEWNRVRNLLSRHLPSYSNLDARAALLVNFFNDVNVCLSYCRCHFANVQRRMSDLLAHEVEEDAESTNHDDRDDGDGDEVATL